jgi:hypothetical protein
MQKLFRSSVLAVAFTLPTCGFLPVAIAQSIHSNGNTDLLVADPGALTPPVSTVPQSSVVAALEVNGPGTPMPRMPQAPRSSVVAALEVNGPGTPMPRMPQAPRSSVVAALEVNGPGTPMPRMPQAPRSSGNMRLKMAV